MDGAGWRDARGRAGRRAVVRRILIGFQFIGLLYFPVLRPLSPQTLQRTPRRHGQRAVCYCARGCKTIGVKTARAVRCGCAEARLFKISTIDYEIGTSGTTTLTPQAQPHDRAPRTQYHTTLHSPHTVVSDPGGNRLRGNRLAVSTRTRRPPQRSCLTRVRRSCSPRGSLEAHSRRAAAEPV